MTKHHIKRLVGYGLWTIALLVFLPPSLLNAQGPPGIGRFLLFNAMVLLFLLGYWCVDSANFALGRKQRKHH